jgi:MFS family permease
MGARSLSYLELLKENRNFRLLLAGQFISELGNWFNFIAGLGLVRVVSEASPSAAGILFVCRIIPFAIISPIAGTFVDRFSRRQVMIISDVVRVAIALLFILVKDADDLWLAYLATALLSSFGAFFEGAKNAATPNLTGKEGLLAGTALMFSTRFLLMAVGSALGGWASALFGYDVAFIINAASFLVSAWTVWLIPEKATREQQLITLEVSSDKSEKFIHQLKEGISYAFRNHFALTILLLNVIWATGGGAINIIFERVGGVYFSHAEGWNADIAVALLWTATGAGLTVGMLLAHRIGVLLDLYNLHRGFVGWSLVIHGVIFALAALSSDLLVFSILSFVSRLIIGIEYAVQEALFQRSLPDEIRGRISTLDRGAETFIYGLSSYVSGELMYSISPFMLTAGSGILSGLAGIIWFARIERDRKFG